MIYKKSDDYSYALGVYPTIELIRSRPKDVIRVLISSKGTRNKGLDEIVVICRKLNIPIETADSHIERLSKSENCYAVAIFRKYSSNISTGRDHILLENPSDMGNLGTIIRTMVGFEFHDLAIIKPGVDIFDPKVIRTSLGSLFKINYEYFDSIEEYLRNHHNRLYCFTGDSDNRLSKMKFEAPLTLAFGNEGAGLSDDLRKQGQTVYIPQNDDIDSLNLAVSVGIALYSRSLQRV